MTEIKALTFDTGGTILDWHTGISRALAAAGARHDGGLVGHCQSFGQGETRSATDRHGAERSRNPRLIRQSDRFRQDKAAV